MSAKWQHRELVILPEPKVVLRDGHWFASAEYSTGEVAGYVPGWFLREPTARTRAKQLCATVELRTGIRLSLDGQHISWDVYDESDRRLRAVRHGPFKDEEEALNFALATINLGSEP